MVSAATYPALPIPTMPSPPAALTAAANRPPATPPIGAFTMGTRRPTLRDQGVDNTAKRYVVGRLFRTVSNTTESSTACNACRCAGMAT